MAMRSGFAAVVVFIGRRPMNSSSAACADPDAGQGHERKIVAAAQAAARVRAVPSSASIGDGLSDTPQRHPDALRCGRPRHIDPRRVMMNGTIFRLQMTLVCAVSCAPGPPECDLPQKDASTTCAAVPDLAGGLPDGSWSGTIEELNTPGDGSGCKALSVNIDDNTVTIEVSGVVSRTSVETWTFADGTNATTEGPDGAAGGDCTCTAAECTCVYAGNVSGEQTLRFNEELLTLTSSFTNGEAATDGNGAAVRACP
jgi:hypothetical protein